VRAGLGFLLAGLVCLAVFISCGDDTPTSPKKKSPAVVWPSLEEKDDVFDYLELVYTQKDSSRYEKLLDDNFNFRFGDDDYNSGITPRDWDRSHEINSVNNLCNNVAIPKYGSVMQIDLDIYPQGIWTEIPKNDPPFAGETWYQKPFTYRILATTTSGWSLKGYDIRALIIVRQSEVEGKNIWRIVQWNDDIDRTYLRQAKNPRSVEECSWGQIKALYTSVPSPGFSR
jgi:hypothetical protein